MRDTVQLRFEEVCRETGANNTRGHVRSPKNTFNAKTDRDIDLNLQTVHPTGMKIGRVKKIMAIGYAESRTLVNVIALASHGYDRIRCVEHGVPARDCSVFVHENKYAGL
jgi:hypothetical protein